LPESSSSGKVNCSMGFWYTSGTQVRCRRTGPQRTRPEFLLTHYAIEQLIGGDMRERCLIPTPF
jgi:hypothetical protein